MTTQKSSTPFDCTGGSTSGDKYLSISDLWKSELASSTHSSAANRQCSADDEQSWYRKSARYWEKQAPSVEGMLGGLGELDSRDIAASKRFLETLDRRLGKRPKNFAVDIGAGIGRVTKHLLLPMYKTVDMLEQNLAYLNESYNFVGNGDLGGAVGKRIACGMQSFRAAGVVGLDGQATGTLEDRYDLIWIQWCVIYLTDDDFVSFLLECTKALASEGIICLKDNVARSGFLVDKDDSSIMRSDKYLKHIFKQAGLEIIREARQLDFPSDVFPVRTYALRPHIHADNSQEVKENKTAPSLHGR